MMGAGAVAPELLKVLNIPLSAPVRLPVVLPSVEGFCDIARI